MIFKRRNEFQCSQAAKRRQQDVYNQRQDGNWWHVFRSLWSESDRNTLLAKLTFPLQTIDKQDWTVTKIYHADIISQSTSTGFFCQSLNTLQAQ